ncbi:sigma-70 family RNA polymerase sigma factor [Paenibacillus terreus]|uniref:Sigma-70 family RNA polymerase sigma factor n=1 Tax=Paenibacillus terreus TaxID=1387834 RepID=A0ABV5BA57_9BACL
MNFEPDVSKAKAGDRHAFVLLMRRIQTDMYGMAYSILQNDDDSADALQETIMQAYQSISSLREPAFFKTWIFRILINKCNQILRKKRRTLHMEALHYEPASSGDEYRQVELREVVNQLDESMRVVVTLRYFQDMQIREISDVLDISESAVKTRLHRARKVLINMLQYSGEGKAKLNEGY